MKIPTNGMKSQESYFNHLKTNTLDQENSVEKDGSIIQIHPRKEDNGQMNKTNKLLIIS